MRSAEDAAGIVHDGTLVAKGVVIGFSFSKLLDRSSPVLRECFIDGIFDIGRVGIIAVTIPELSDEVSFVIFDDFLLPIFALRLLCLEVLVDIMVVQRIEKFDVILCYSVFARNEGDFLCDVLDLTSFMRALVGTISA